MPTDLSKIKFDSATHTYTYNRQPLMPVTSLIKWITPEFDSDTILKRTAKKTGRSILDIQKEWDEKRDIGLEKGTRVHNYVENVLEGQDVEVMRQTNDYIHEMKEFDRAWSRLQDKLKARFIRKEWTVGDAELGVAGRVDAIISLDIKDKQRKCIFDWKTGKFMTRKHTKESMLPPFDDLPHCEEVKYSIQLSLYRLLIERNTDEDIHNCFIMHLPADSQYQLYNAMDLRSRLENWLLDLRSTGRLGDPQVDKDYLRLIREIDKVNIDDIKICSPQVKARLWERILRIKKELCQSMALD